jgi:MFS family permease
MVYGLGGLGSLVAALSAPRLGARLGVRACMSLGLALGAVGLALAVLAPSRAPGLALGFLAAQQLLGDGGWTLFLVHAESLRMRLAPAAARSRVAAGAGALTVVARLAGAAVAAVLGARFGARGALAVGAGVVALAVPLSLGPALARGITRASSTT